MVYDINSEMVYLIWIHQRSDKVNTVQNVNNCGYHSGLIWGKGGAGGGHCLSPQMKGKN